MRLRELRRASAKTVQATLGIAVERVCAARHFESSPCAEDQRVLNLEREQKDDRPRWRVSLSIDYRLGLGDSRRPAPHQGPAGRLQRRCPSGSLDPTPAACNVGFRGAAPRGLLLPS